MPLRLGIAKKSTRYNAAALYGRIVKQARKPVFYEELGVPDTIDGRFDLEVLHVFLVVRRLGEGQKVTESLRQELFNAMFMNMDSSLREMGVGDLSVGKRIKKMAKAFYGRVEAYEGAMASGDRELLGEALARNLFRGERAKEGAVVGISDYMLATGSNLMEQPLERFRLGLVDFSGPA